MTTITRQEVERKRAETLRCAGVFDLERQLERFTEFVIDRYSDALRRDVVSG
jgi:hypothetical protein